VPDHSVVRGPAPAGAVAPHVVGALADLRARLGRILLALSLGFVAAYAVAREVFVLSAMPLLDVWEKRQAAGAIGPPALHFASLVDPFLTYVRQSFWLAIFLASPVIFHQLWAFAGARFRTADESRPRMRAWPLAATSAALFVGGAAFCYAVVMPLAFDFLLGYATPDLTDGVLVGDATAAALHPTLFMNEYLDLSRGLMLGFGLVFELPLVVYVLARLGLVTPRALWRFNRWAIVLAFAIGAVLTPGPDVLSQLLMAGPLVVLYNASILVALITARRRGPGAAGQ
jgi:sec-independent protein translocase protein TatC